MARVTGPLMSMDASGTVAGAIVFSRWKGLPYVRRHAIPSNPRSAKQISMRAMMSFLSRNWATTVTPGADWIPPASTRHMSAFNLYIGDNQAAWRSFKAPSTTYVRDELGTAPSAGVVTASGGVRSSQLSIADGANPPDWGYLVFGQIGATPVPSISSLVGVMLWTGSPTVFVHTPIAIGTWHYIVTGFLTTGKKGGNSTDQTAVVT